ncbi:MAG: metallophosphoesterase [Planctomycetes bacterium]|nr:metallophosphoesterase [Planctomycetota bacterium]
MRLEPDASPELRVAPRRHGPLRRSAVWTVEHVTAWLGGRALYRRRHLAAGRFAVREERVAIRGLSPRLAGFTIAQLSDLHAGTFLREGDLAAVVEHANGLRPDLVVLTGDFITRHWSEALLVRSDLARLRARHGVFAVLGNHDYKDRAEARIVASYAEVGVRFLCNQGVRLVDERGAFGLIGVEDIEESKQLDLAAARVGLSPDEPEIVLCHNPRGALPLARSGADLVLSGHTHGSQLDLPWMRRAGPPHPGVRLQLGATTLVVSRGLGVIGFPLRVGAPAELVVVRLEGGA